MKEKSFYYKTYAALTSIALAVTGCGSKFTTGQELTAAENITVITNHDSINPETGTNPQCTIPAGSPVEIGEFSSIPISNSERQSLVELISDCTGWTPNISSLNDKLIEK